MVKTEVMHYVVGRNFSYAMTGQNRRAMRGTVYAVFATEAKAHAYVEANKMRLYARVVSL